MDPREKELRDRHAELKTLISAFTAKASLTVEEAGECDTLIAEFEAIPAQLAAIEQEKRDHAARQNRFKVASSVPAPRRTQPEQLPAAGVPAPQNTEAQFVNDPKKGFKSPREFLTSVINAGRGMTNDQRLNYMTVGSDEARVNSDPAGGFLVPTGFLTELLQVKPFPDPLGDRTRKIPMATPIVNIPARTDKDHSSSVSGGVTFTRRPETVSGTASQMTFEKVTLAATEIFGLSYASEEILTDSPISFAALLEAGFQDQRTYHMTNERLFGTGVGEYLGMANASNPCLVSITKETGQAGTTLVYENIIKMRARCWGYGDAVWLANFDTIPQLVLMNQSVGTGGAVVFQPSAREDVPDMLLGRPIVFTEYCKTLGTTGDLILANPTQYLEGIYQPLQSAESMHVRFVNHERTFKFWERNAGWPWWKSALTPVNGSNTLSPFVTVATRS